MSPRAEHPERRRGFYHSGLFACAGLLGALPAFAEANEAAGPLSVSLTYAAPPGCPSSAEFEAGVVGRLGFDPFVARARRQVLVSIAPTDRALEGRIEWRDADGRWAGDQTFPEHTNDCADLVRAMGFALAVQINLLSAKGSAEPSAGSAADPPRGAGSRADAASRADGTARAEAPGRTARPPSSDDAATAPDEEPPRRGSTPWIRELGAGASLGFGLLPDTVGMGRVFGHLSRGPLAFELAAELSSASDAQRDDGAGFRGRVFLASAAACGVRAPFSVCALGKAGTLRVSGERIDVSESATGLAAQLGLRLRVQQRLGRAFLAEKLEGLVNLTRSTVTLDELPVWRAPAFSATLGLDAGWSFQ